MVVRFGPQVCGSLDEGASREWLVADGLGGYAMGTVAGLRTRRYHGLLVVAADPPGSRHLGLASLDPVVVIGDRRTRLGTHAWVGGAVDPAGHQFLSSFVLDDGVPRWRWAVGPVTVEAEVATRYGEAGIAVVYTLVRAPGPLVLEMEALCTWRDVHGERFAGPDPGLTRTVDGFVFEGAYRVAGPDFAPVGTWYRNVRYPVEAERGLNDHEDLWFAGRFSTVLTPGQSTGVSAWAGDLATGPPPPVDVVTGRRTRARALLARAGATDEVDRALVLAADQFVTTTPGVIAGYPWFGTWSRDSFTSYEGLFLTSGRSDEGRRLLEAAAATVSQGMVANTADTGTLEYNTVDGALWFIHAAVRHVETLGDLDLATGLAGALLAIVNGYLAGTRFGIRSDPADGLVTQGAPGVALTWMDARVDGQPVTPRAGKPVEVNALWISGLTGLARVLEQIGRDPGPVRRVAEQARTSFLARFPDPGGGLYDVVDGPGGIDRSVRPNQLLAVSLPDGPARSDTGLVASILARAATLATPLGMRSLSPEDPAYRGQHRGGPADRDRAYHQGTVWPWLMGPYADALIASGRPEPAGALLDGLEAHLGEWGVGSVSETADGDVPHGATGCPWQAWSVAELLRVRRVTRSLSGTARLAP